MNRYRQGLEATGGVEPISRFHEAFQGPVDAAYAAVVVGLETETFLEKVRENTGLQNVGLLALEGENGSVKRDAWTSSFRDVISALDYPQLVGEPPIITHPDVIPGAHVPIPDPNLRAAVADELRKSINAPITVEEMKGLRRLRAENRGIRDLTGLHFATNLSELFLQDNQIPDLSPLAGLIELRELRLEHNPISDLVPLKGLKNLTYLRLYDTQISDLSPLAELINLRHLAVYFGPFSDVSPLAGLTNLEHLAVTDSNVSDLSPLAGLTNLEFLDVGNNKVSDLSPLAGLVNLKELLFFGRDISDISPLGRLVNLKRIGTWGNPFSDLSPLAKLTKLEVVNICGAKLSDLSPLTGLTGLKELYLAGNGISDISPIARLTGLERLNLHHNHISNISPLAGLTNLKWLDVDHNAISDFSPLDGLRENTKLVWYNNPGGPKGGPKIEGPWLWVVLPDARLERGTDLLSEVTGGRITENQIAVNGATVGKPVGDDEWTAHNIAPTGSNNIRDMFNFPMVQKQSSMVLYPSIRRANKRQPCTLVMMKG